MLRSTLLSAFVLAATGVSAHATFQELFINGVDQVKKCTRLPNSNNPITSPSGSDITCNAGGNTPAPSTCPINAGDSLIVEMHQHDTRGCGEEAIGGAHYGPVIIYMSKVSDAATTNPQSAGWFKIAQTGLITSSPKWWGTDQMNKDCGKVSFKVPSDIAPGNYLIRAEVIALHVASQVGGAQFYVSCYQVSVSGSGSASPATVRFPGAYSASDPGILVDINKGGFNSYTIPGPAVYSGGGGGSNPSQTTVQQTTVKTSTAAPTQTTASGETVKQYGQCGGNDYKGPTTCASPYKCVGVSVPYYYQCQ